MPVRPCPACGRPSPRYVSGVSETALVNYYRCEACGHVFAVSKDNPDGPHRDITVSAGNPQAPPSK